MKDPNPISALLNTAATNLALFASRKEDQERLAKVLRAGGYNEIHAFSGTPDEHTLQTMAREAGTVDIIFAAYDTLKDSLDLCKRMKTLVTFQDVPFIVVASNPTPEGMQMAFATGAMDFLSSPPRDYELLARTRSALRLKYEIDRRKAREKELLEAARQLADLSAVLEGLAVIDTLTGVGNRRLFDRSLNQEWRRCYRSKQPLTLILADVDNFKSFNDRFGHMAGDECLKQLANGIRGCLRRAGDIICRYGGEEFGIILPDTPMEGGKIVAETIRSTIEKLAINCNGLPPQNITLSLGVCGVVPCAPLTPVQLITTADAALYQAKHAGRNTIRTSAPPPAAPPKAA